MCCPARPLEMKIESHKRFNRSECRTPPDYDAGMTSFFCRFDSCGFGSTRVAHSLTPELLTFTCSYTEEDPSEAVPTLSANHSVVLKRRGGHLE
jgi:hypothetical protein